MENNDSFYTWTCDVDGGDYGGRTPGTIGINEGLPAILKLFERKKIRGLFFISTELIEKNPNLPKSITRDGHRLGSHGHFHVKYSEEFRALQDKKMSERILVKYTHRPLPYRAPKFSFRTECVYSNPKNHVGLLKHMWFGGKIPKEPIFYLHPFDLVEGKNAPNLFCKIWYNHPQKAYDTLDMLTDRYPGNNRL